MKASEKPGFYQVGDLVEAKRDITWLQDVEKMILVNARDLRCGVVVGCRLHKELATVYTVEFQNGQRVATLPKFLKRIPLIERG